MTELPHQATTEDPDNAAVKIFRSQDLPAFEAILRRIESTGMDGLAAADRGRLMALPFKLVEAQQHISEIAVAILRVLAERLAFMLQDYGRMMSESEKEAVH